MRWSQSFRLVGPEFWVDVRLTHIHGRWIASADTSDGPSLGLGYLPRQALRESLTPFDDAVEDLMRTFPEIDWR